MASKQTFLFSDGVMTAIPRLLLGLIFVTGSIDGFYYVFTHTELIKFPTSPKGAAFVEGLRAADFFWPFMKTLQLLGGLSLTFRIFPAVGFLILVPIITTIVLFHFTINRPGIIFGVVLVVLSTWLFQRYKSDYARLLERR